MYVHLCCGLLSTHRAVCSCLPHALSRVVESIGRGKMGKLVGWDRVFNKVKERGIKATKQENPKWCKSSSLLLPINRLMDSPWKPSCPLQPLSTTPIFIAGHDITCYGITPSSVCLLFCLYPLPTSCPPQPTCWGRGVQQSGEKERALMLCKHCSATDWRAVCYQHKSTAPYGLLWRKLILF